MLHRDAYGTATRSVTRYIFIARATAPPTPPRSEIVPPAGWSDGGQSSTVPTSLAGEAKVWVSVRTEQRLLASPTTIQSFGNWGAPSDARAAPVPTIQFSGYSESNNLYRNLTVSWGTFPDPSNVRLVEVQTEILDQNGRWQPEHTWTQSITGTGSGGSITLSFLWTAGTTTRVRIRSLSTDLTSRSEPTDWVEARSPRFAAETPRPFFPPRPTGTGELTVLGPDTPVPLPWQYRYRVISTCLLYTSPSPRD